MLEDFPSPTFTLCCSPVGESGIELLSHSARSGESQREPSAAEGCTQAERRLHPDKSG